VVSAAAAAVVAAVSGLFSPQPARVVTASAAQTAVPKNLFFIVTSSLFFTLNTFALMLKTV
jgi:hypothetical protein